MKQEDYIIRRHTIFLELTVYIKFQYNCNPIGRISFLNPEINCNYLFKTH